uniref:Cation-dependent mannose-6-phosphate receptor n=1 Tax=Callorhinchus milii TaxID=7868 RepID=V9KUF3_CALMI
MSVCLFLSLLLSGMCFVVETLKFSHISLDCDLVGKDSEESKHERDILRRLQPISGHTFTVQTALQGDTTYLYSFRLCQAVTSQFPGGGLLQQNLKNNETKVIGRYNQTQLIGGSDWVMLIYNGGDVYGEHCDGERRKAIIMISCQPGVLAAGFVVVLEEREKISDCFYLFELDSYTVCPSISHQLSPGSIMLIVCFVLLFLYILGGFMYQRLIVRAKGFDQIPHLSFWRNLGNLSADGCDLICRSKPRNVPAAYRGIGDEDGNEEDDQERDEHLLPM